MIAQAAASGKDPASLFWLGLVLLIGGVAAAVIGRKNWHGWYPEGIKQIMDEPYQSLWGLAFLAGFMGIVSIYAGLGLIVIAIAGADIDGIAGWIWGIPAATGCAVTVLVVFVYQWIGLPDRWLPPHQRRSERERRQAERNRSRR